jgi:hypothetical protein
MSEDLSDAFRGLVGTVIDRAMISDDGVTVILGGSGFSLWVIAPWRVVRLPAGRLVASAEFEPSAVAVLTGSVVRRVGGQSNFGGFDPALLLGEDYLLEVFSDCAIDPWSMSVGDVHGVVGDAFGGREWFGRAETILGDDVVAPLAPFTVTIAERDGWSGRELVLGGRSTTVRLRGPWRVVRAGAVVAASSDSTAVAQFLVDRDVLGWGPQGAVAEAGRAIRMMNGTVIEAFATTRTSPWQARRLWANE